MKMSKLSNQTNSQDPQAVNSRVFVGNLNTFQCSKTDVERMFQKYGRLAGISMHKGYAFVQFTNPFDARNACLGEDGRTVLSQILDVNMVAEPKPHQTGRKRQNLSKTGNDWDYYYDSYYASTLFTPTPPRPLKRQRLMSNQNRSSPIPNKILTTNAIAPQQQQPPQQQQQNPNNHQPHQNGNGGGGGGITLNNGLEQQPQQQQIYQLNGTLGSTTNCSASNGSASSLSSQSSTASIQIQSSTSPNPTQQNNNGHHLLGPFKVYSNPDTLICGNCRECFTELSELLDHKKSYCKLRFICKCQATTTSSMLLASTPTSQEFNSNNNNNNDNLQNSPKLLCVVCKEPFKNPWDLMVHAQAAHMINIYELGDTPNNNNNNNNDTNINNNNDNNHHDNSNDNDDNNNTDKKEMVHVTNGLNGIAEMKDDNSSIHGSPYKDDTSNVHSSNENLYEDQLSSSSPILSNDEHMKQNGHDSEDDGVCEAKRSCIMRTLSIEAIPAPTNVNPLSMVTNAIGMAIANGTVISQ